MRFSNSSLAMAAALMLGFTGVNATAQTYRAPTNQPRTDQAPGAKSDITRVQAGSDPSGVVSGHQGGTGIKGSAQGEGATNKDVAPRDSVPE